MQTIDGFKTRTPFQTDVSLQLSYTLPLGGSQKIHLAR
jgi:hypothetical protein